MKKTYTHRGVITGCDRRVQKGYRRTVILRKTKTMWITEDESRFRRDEGSIMNGSGFGDRPMYQLVEIEELSAD